jgi:hypothetical protein
MTETDPFSERLGFLIDQMNYVGHSPAISTHFFININIYERVRVCACVCLCKERKKEGRMEGGNERNKAEFL